MKRLFTLSGLVIIIIKLLSACYNDNEVLIPVLEDEHEHPTFLTYCPGDKTCLPFWNSDHTVLLTCKGIATYSQYVSNSGSMFFSHNDDDYKLTYSVSCSSSSTCANCKESKSFVKKGNNNGNIGSEKDCQKEYLSYVAETQPYINSQIKIVCTSPQYMQDNEYDYLKVDSYKVYKTVSGGPDQLVQSGSVIPGTTLINLPNQLNVYYQLRLYSSNCEYNTEHYRYKNYQGQTGSTPVIDGFDFMVLNAHF